MKEERYPLIADYGVISECHTAALVSRSGSIDWCCMPRLDSGTYFGRIVDWDKGGFCSITPTAPEWTSDRRYVDETLVLEAEVGYPLACRFHLHRRDVDTGQMSQMAGLAPANILISETKAHV